jgi:hypothetical protein
MNGEAARQGRSTSTTDICNPTVAPPHALGRVDDPNHPMTKHRPEGRPA